MVLGDVKEQYYIVLRAGQTGIKCSAHLYLPVHTGVCSVGNALKQKLISSADAPSHIKTSRVESWEILAEE